MNAALFSSKKMDYCTPQAFFDELNREFHFTLDAAATDKSAKCPAYFTPDTDGLKSPWNVAGGVLYSATLHTGRERMDIRGRFAQPCVGRRYERSKFGQRSDQLEHRPARKYRTGRGDEGCFLCALRLIGLERGDQHPHETAGTHADHKCPRLCRGIRPSGS